MIKLVIDRTYFEFIMNIPLYIYIYIYIFLGFVMIKLLSLISRPLSPIFHFTNLTGTLSVLQDLNKFFENVL